MSRLTSSSSSRSSSSSPYSIAPISNKTAVTTATTDTGDGEAKLQVFLGGSCNPTTWRQNVAIPYLEMNGISYYNPQVDNWTPEVVVSERYAKQNAEIVLIVIDRQTRSTVSIVESAFMAGENTNLVLVVYPFEYNVLSLTDESRQTSNFIETRSKVMKTSRTISQYKDDSSSPVKSSSTSASSSTLVSSSSFSPRVHESYLSSASTRSSSTTKTTLTAAQVSSKTTTDHCELSDERRLDASREEAKRALGTIRLSGELISLSEYNELKLARHMLQSLLDIQKIPMFSEILQALKYVSCSLSDGKNPHQAESLKNLSLNLTNNTHQSSLNLLDHEPSLSDSNTNHHHFIHEGHRGDSIKDVYLSLDSDDPTSLESTVIPILEETGLTYNCMLVNNIMRSNPTSTRTVVMPNLSIDTHKADKANELTALTTTSSTTSAITSDLSAIYSDENTRLAIEKEICAIRSSRVLLFVITSKCRGLSIMVLASHFMALFRNNVVLCVQYLEEPCSIGGETLTKTAVADYNRGRVYLCDYAIKSQVPVFSTIREAIEFCSRKCHYKHNKN